MEYDWRTRFRMGLDEMPDAMGWDEAARLAVMLRRDPSSAIASALEGWDYPISREALLLADLYDLTGRANSDPKKGKWTPHPGRPWKSDNRDRVRRGNAGSRTPEQVKAILAEHGHAPV